MKETLGKQVCNVNSMKLVGMLSNQSFYRVGRRAGSARGWPWGGPRAKSGRRTRRGRPGVCLRLPRVGRKAESGRRFRPVKPARQAQRRNTKPKQVFQQQQIQSPPSVTPPFLLKNLGAAVAACQGITAPRRHDMSTQQ